MLLTNLRNQINGQIGIFQDEIARLQAEVTKLQQHLQEVQGTEAACESAIAQIDTALGMLGMVCPEQISTFKAAIDAKFTTEIPQLMPVDASEETVEPLPEPAPETEVSNEVIEVKAVEIDEVEVLPEPPTESNDNEYSSNGNGNGHHLLSYEDLKKCDRHTLVKLANQHGIDDYKSKKRDELARVLKGMVTTDELAQLQNTKK